MEHRGFGGRRAARVFVGFAKEDQGYCEALEKHLKVLRDQGVIALWHVGKVAPGKAWESEKQNAMRRADVVVFLTSADFVASRDCWEGDLMLALKRQAAGEAIVIPIFVRPVDLKGTALEELEPLPKGGQVVSLAPDKDAVWTEVSQGLRTLLEGWNQKGRGGPSWGPAGEDWDAVGRGLQDRSLRSPLVGKVERVVKLRFPDATLETHEAADPFDGLMVVTERLGRVAKIRPVGVLDGPMSVDALEVFTEEVEAPFRKQNPLLEALIVHTGKPAPEELFDKALRRGVELATFDEYQQIVKFDRYLEWQTRRVDADPHYPEAIYVDQRAEVRIRLAKSLTDDALEEVAKLLMDPYPRLILVLGDFGTGKTFLMRQLARKLARVYQADAAAAPAPVLVEMRSLEKSLGLNKLLAQHFQEQETGRIPVDVFRYLLEEGKAALLFDGFDELAFRVTYDRVIEHFQTVLEASQGKAKVVVTSRTAHFLNDQDAELELARKAANVEGYRLVKLFPFDEKQIHRALVKRLGSVEAADQRMDHLCHVEDLKGLSANPRMLDFILELPEVDLVEARQKTSKISAASLYEILVTRWLKFEEDRARPKGAEPALTSAQLWHVVTDFALLLWERSEKAILWQDVPKELWERLQKLDPTRALDPEQAAHSAGARSLLSRSGEGRFSFMHESILDWLVAKAASAEVREKGEAPALWTRKMSDLMTDFFCALAKPDVAIGWARQAFSGGNDVAIQNANRVLRRLGADRVDEEIVVDLDLSGHDLRGQDFSGSEHLRGADLSGANLSGATLVGADLSGANLSGAVIVAANLERGTLANANLENGDLSRSRLVGADLRGVKWKGSKLKYANLLRADVTAGALESEDEHGAESWAACPPRPAFAEPCTSASLEQGGMSGSMGLAVSPDGVFLAAGNSSGEIGLWDLESGRPLRTWGAHESAITSLAFSPDGTFLASASEDTTIRLWDPASGKLLRTLRGHERAVLSVAFSPDGTLASGSDNTTIRLWEPASATLLRTLQGHKKAVASIAFSPDGALLASGSLDHTICLWEPASATLRRTLEGHKSFVLSVAFSPDGNFLASGSGDNTIRLWDPRSATLVAILKGHKSHVRDVAFSADGKFLASGSWDATIRLWDPRSTKLLGILEGHHRDVSGVAFSPNGTLASGSFDNTVRLWDPNSKKGIRTLEGHKNSIESVAFSPDGTALASGDEDGKIRLWDPHSTKLLTTLEGHKNSVWSVAFSPDGKFLASSSYPNTICLWDPIAAKGTGTLEGHQNLVSSVVFSPNGNVLASGSFDNTIRLWNPRSTKAVATLEGHKSFVLSVTFSFDGTLLASGSYDNTIRLWDPRAAKLLATLEGHTNSVGSVAFSPEGSLLASGSYDKTIRLWDPRSPTLLRTLQGHTNDVGSVAFSPDGKFLASGSQDHTIRLWDPVSAKLLATLEGHTSVVRSITFSPDGKTLVSASNDGTMRLWRVADGACLAVLVPAEQGWAAYSPDGRYKFAGDVANRFWHVVGLVRFEPGELEGHENAFTQQKPIRIPEDAPLW